MAGKPRSYGFWRGFVFGLVLAAALGLVLAWRYPPLKPPEVSPGAMSAPGAPDAPDALPEPQPPRADGLLPAPPSAPVIPGVPTPDAAPAASAGAAGSPSLMPKGTP